MKYFVAYVYWNDSGKYGFGNCETHEMKEIATYQDVCRLHNVLEKELGVKIVILSYKPLGSPSAIYNRCGDCEQLVTSGNPIIFKPNITVNVQGNISADEVVKAMYDNLRRCIEKTKE